MSRTFGLSDVELAAMRGTTRRMAREGKARGETRAQQFARVVRERVAADRAVTVPAQPATVFPTDADVRQAIASAYETRTVCVFCGATRSGQSAECCPECGRDIARAVRSLTEWLRTQQLRNAFLAAQTPVQRSEE